MSDEFGPLAIEVLMACRARGWHVGTAESCTGGLVGGALTAIAGSSDVVEGGFITYSNEVKTALLGVPKDLLDRVGAVSAEVAAAMAQGVLNNIVGTDLAVSITGIAGPGGGTATKPVGLVYFGVACRGKEGMTERHVFPGDRQAVRAAAVRRALTLLFDAAR